MLQSVGGISTPVLSLAMASGTKAVIRHSK